MVFNGNKFYPQTTAVITISAGPRYSDFFTTMTTIAQQFSVTWWGGTTYKAMMFRAISVHGLWIDISINMNHDQSDDVQFSSLKARLKVIIIITRINKINR